MSANVSLREYLDFAMDAAWQAGHLTLAHFQAGVAIEEKPDHSPVTVADRSAEELLRRLIATRFPGHAVVGEEFGETERDSTHRWILDPIDGTRSFVRGVPLYGVLVGLEIGGESVVGVAHFPALGETVAAARGEGCRWNGRTCRVSAVSRLEDALVLCSDAGDLARRAPRASASLRERSVLQRGWGDCYGHCLVATGRAEVMLDPVMSAWDCAALLPILSEAGGFFGDWSGRATAYGGNAVGTNAPLREPVLALLAGEPVA
jgi:histidinol-phosphatase